MLQRQKETILALLKRNEANRNYEKSYWVAYNEFLDPTDDFTDFACENLEGKQQYIDLIESLLREDENAKIFVDVYGFEESKDEQFIYADTLIIFSRLPLERVKQIFNAPEDIFPSDVGEITDLSQQDLIVNDNGELLSTANLSENGVSAYYCWWD